MKMPKQNITTTTTSRRLTRRRVAITSLTADLLFHFRWRAEGVIGRWRRHRPFQTLGTVPGFGRSRLAAADALDDDEQEQQLRRPEHEGTDAGDHVEVGEHHVVVGDAPRHAGQTGE